MSNEQCAMWTAPPGNHCPSKIDLDSCGVGISLAAWTIESQRELWNSLKRRDRIGRIAAPHRFGVQVLAKSLLCNVTLGLRGESAAKSVLESGNAPGGLPGAR